MAGRLGRPYIPPRLFGEVQPLNRPNPSKAPPSAAPFRIRVRMVYLLLAVFAFVALAPLSSVAWRLIDGNREALKTSQQEYQLLLASTISREVDIHVEALRAQLVRGSRSLAIASTRPSGVVRDEARRVLEELLDERMRYLRFTDMHGAVVDSRTGSKIPEGLEPSFLAGFRAAAESLAENRQLGAAAAAHAAPLLLPGEPRRAALVLTAPVVSGGRFLGVIAALVDLQSVWDAVASDLHSLTNLDI